MNKLLKEFLLVIPFAIFFILFAWTINMVGIRGHFKLGLIYGFFLGSIVIADLIQKKYKKK